MKKILAIVTSLVLVCALTVEMPAAAAGMGEASDTEVASLTSSLVLEGDMKCFSSAGTEDMISGTEDMLSYEMAGFASETIVNEQEPQMAVFSARAATASGTCGTNLTWTLENQTLTIAGTGAMTDYDAGKAPWYGYAGSITKIVIGSGATKVGTYAFYNLPAVTSVSVPSTVTTIEGGAFYKCTSLAEVVLPASVKTLGAGAFAECFRMSKFSAPGLKEIGRYALQSVAIASSAGGLDLVLPKTLTSIDDAAFYNGKIKSFTVESGNGTYQAKSGVLYKDNGKTLVAYPNGNGATTFTVTAGVTKVGSYAFAYNPSLTSVTFSDGILSLEKWAFYGCDGIGAVTLPKSVTFVHPLAFSFSTKVTCNNTALKKYAGTGYRALEEVSISVEKNYDMAYQVLDLVNAERTKAGLSKLVMNQGLLDAAVVRAGETALLFSHTRPCGTSCFSVSGSMNAENIAMGQTTAKEVMEAWMASANHKANILSDSATSIGIGCIKHNGYYYWVQCFGNTGDTANCAKPANATANQSVMLALENFGEAPSYITDLSQIYDVYEGAFAFNPLISVKNKKVGLGKTTQAQVYVINQGYPLVSAKLNNAGITWSSDNTAVAKIDSAGKITAVAAGSAELTGKMQHFTLKTPFVLGVRRIYGKSRYETAFATANTLKATLGVSKFDAVIVATGDNYADALSGSYLASLKKAPILLVNAKNETNVKNYIKANVNSGGMVYILGGTGAVAASMEKGLTGYKMERLSGKSRYDTNLAILNEAGATADKLLVCTGNNYADSLSASATGQPLLLVTGDSLTADQLTYIKKLSPEEIYIIGGSAAVSEKMETTLKKYGTVQRLSGKDRYQTSVKVADAFFQAPSAAVLAYGQNFPDGLCGGPLAVELNAPLILSETYQYAVAEYYADYMGIGTGLVLGGDSLIADDTVKKVFDMGDSDKIIAVNYK